MSSITDYRSPRARRAAFAVGSFAVWALLLACQGCSSQGALAQRPDDSRRALPSVRAPLAPADAAEASDATTGHDQPARQSTMRKLERAGLDNLWHVSERIYSGAQPNGDEAFANLRKLGVETIVSVDGARPNVEAARKAGLRYIHVPIGYDGISQQAGASLARVVKEIRGSIYIHCHHGRHRAPAAAAVASIVDGGVDDPRRILEVAGTSPRYTGLWRDVAAYQPPPHDSNLPALVEVAEIESLTAAMAKIDRIADNLSLCRNAKWEIPADHPDVVAEEQALLLKESFREAARNVPPDQSTQLKEWLTAAEATAAALENSLVDGRFDEATRLLVKTTQDCRRCHEKHRN